MAYAMISGPPGGGLFANSGTKRSGGLFGAISNMVSSTIGGNNMSTTRPMAAPVSNSYAQESKRNMKSRNENTFSASIPQPNSIQFANYSFSPQPPSQSNKNTNADMMPVMPQYEIDKCLEECNDDMDMNMNLEEFEDSNRQRSVKQPANGPNPDTLVSL